MDRLAVEIRGNGGVSGVDAARRGERSDGVLETGVDIRSFWVLLFWRERVVRAGEKGSGAALGHTIGPRETPSIP